MITSIKSVIQNESLSSNDILSEVEFLSSTLSLLRDSDEISNDQFLEAGSIQGGLNLLCAMISNGAADNEIKLQASSLMVKTESLCSKHQKLDAIIESKR